MRMHWSAALAVAAAAQTAAPHAAAAQDEGALRRAFEGRSVTLRIDMPATSQGVDVRPQEDMPVDFRQVADRLKDNGTAVKTGQSVMVTKVVVKKSHIEFQLGGGGYGTFGDWMTSGSSVSTTNAGESKEERDLRDAAKHASDDEKKRLERQADALRSTRERENGRAQAEAQQANLAREAGIRSKRLEAGSRFNIRYKDGIPADGLTPAGVARALSQYADFSNVPGAGAVTVASAAPGASVAAFAATGAAAGAARSAAAPAGGIGGLRKGLSLAEVEALLGPAATAAESKDGSMTVTKRTYRPEGAQVAASFVGGVLVDYAITPR
ncbi:hypothetical protein tb265_12670 [Gemmatimonadetes bacterium T265]|nr:hypothetical protein tb265_12670 [Gemmatimonadetes bacterium T265]